MNREQNASTMDQARFSQAGTQQAVIAYDDLVKHDEQDYIKLARAMVRVKEPPKDVGEIFRERNRAFMEGVL